MRAHVAAAALGLACSLAAPAAAKEVIVGVDAKAGPWLNRPNKKMRYGIGDETPPATVTGFINDADEKLAIYPAPGATTRVDGQDVGTEGIAGEAVDDMPGAKGKYYPSLYAPKILYPTNRHALIAAFVDVEGRLMGRPFAVGQGVRVTIPDQAAALTLGFNDVSFTANEGTLAVVVSMPD